jgi:dGTPase
LSIDNNYKIRVHISSFLYKNILFFVKLQLFVYHDILNGISNNNVIIKEGNSHMANYNKLSDQLQKQIENDQQSGWKNPYAFNSGNVVRRNMDRDKANLWRPAFVRDIDKITNIPYYNRYADKTQVFSFVKNDDICRRSLHVQYVSRIARNIGRVLGLNLDLIEAIALGHDIGHTPFGHAGERMLNDLYNQHTGRYFNHNVHSVRVLDNISRSNISLQTLDGVLCHNGELEQDEYKPCRMNSFQEFDKKVEACYVNQESIGALVPSTLEGCVVRISDIIAYIGKDRQDAIRLGLLSDDDSFSNGTIGVSNAEMINNLVVNIIENSYGQPYLRLSPEHFQALSGAKRENYNIIYGNADLNNEYSHTIKPMMERMYELFLHDLTAGNENSLIFRHHVAYVNDTFICYSYDKTPYLDTEPNQIVVDFIASMTDDYFIDAYNYLFPEDTILLEYKGYFE